MQALNVKLISSEQNENILLSKNSAKTFRNKDSVSKFEKLLHSKSEIKASQNSLESEKEISLKSENQKKVAKYKNVSSKDSKLSTEDKKIQKKSDLNDEKSFSTSEILCNEKSENEISFENQILSNLEENFNADFNQNQNISSEISSEMLSSETSISSQQLSYLTQKESAGSDFDSMIENASEYVPVSSDSYILERAQNLSVEEPGEFLKKADLSHTRSASQNEMSQLAFFYDLNESGENNSSDFQNADSFNQDDKNFFTLKLNDSNSSKNQVFEVRDERSFEEKIKSVLEKSDGTEKKSLDFTLSMNEGFQNNVSFLNAHSDGAGGANFQQLLSQSVGEHVNDFAKAGTIILKDNNQGEINMNLHPESLGNIKLSLRVSDKIITGQITVHSKEALEAFKQNLESMKQSFIANGFEEANLNLVMEDSSGFSGAFAQSGSQNQESEHSHQFMARRAYGDYVPLESDSSFVSAESDSYKGQSSRVNVVA